MQTLIEQLKKKEGWMDSTDYDCELGQANGGNVVYPSAENCEENRGCIRESASSNHPCAVLKVYVISEEDLNRVLREEKESGAPQPAPTK